MKKLMKFYLLFGGLTTYSTNICTFCSRWGKNYWFLTINILNSDSLTHVGSPRPPFDDLIQRLVSLHGTNNAPKRKPAIISVDIPSGWHVEEGDVNSDGIKPDMLVSI